VDPARDTPAVLKEYAQRYQADLSRWHFLTGTSPQMFQTARQMRLTALPATEKDPILHDVHFVLIDGDGNVRGIYDSQLPAAMKKLVEDAKYLGRSNKGRG
jgi:protein SCO1/2